MCLREELLLQYLLDRLERVYKPLSGISYKFGKVVVGSTWGKGKGKSNTDRIDDIPLFVMPVVS